MISTHTCNFSSKNANLHSHIELLLGMPLQTAHALVLLADPRLVIAHCAPQALLVTTQRLHHLLRALVLSGDAKYRNYLL